MLNRRLTIAIHECAHAIMAYLCNIKYSSVSLIIDPKTNDTKGEVEYLRGPGINPIANREDIGLVVRRLNIYQWMSILVAGYLAGMIFAGEKDFWRVYPKDELMKSDDMMAMKKYCREEYIKKDELEPLLIATAQWLAIPAIWGFINKLADILIKDRKLSAQIFVYAHRDVAAAKPDYSATPLILFILSQIYPDQ